MAEPNKQQIGDGADNYGSAVNNAAKAAKQARDYYLQISFSELHPLMVFCLAKAITKPNTAKE